MKTLAATDILCIKFFDTWVFLNPRTAPIWNITALWDRIFLKENRVTAHSCIKIVGAPNLLIQWRFPHEIFWHCETINSEKTVMPSYSAINISVPRTFSKHRRVSVRIFSALWFTVRLPVFSVFWDTKNFSTELWCHQPPPPLCFPMHDKFRHQKFFEMQKCSPTRLIVSVKKSSTVNGAFLLWCIKFSIAKFFWKTERLSGYKTKFIGTMRHKKNRKNPWCSPALVCEKIFDARFFSNQRKALIQFSTALRAKNFRPKIVIPPYYAWILFDTRKFLKHRNVTQCIFSPLWDKIFWQNPDAFPLLSMRLFYINFFWNTDVFPYEFFRQCDTICFRWKIVITLPRPLFIHKFFVPKEILKNRRVLLWSFPVVRDKKFSKNPWYTPLLCMKIFYITIHLKYRCVPLRILSALWKSNQFKGQKWYPLILHKFFYNGNILKNRGDPIGILYVLWDKKNSIKMWRSSPPLTYYA